MSIRKLVAAVILFSLPILVVYAVKQSDWGPIMAAPKARQLGDPNAKVVVVEYSDFQCPSCARLQPTVHQFQELYKGKVRFVYKYYPLVKLHPNALPAAHAAECAAAEDKFWPYADKLFATQLQWAPLQDATTSFFAIAKDVNVNMTAFKACYADVSRREPILREADEALARGIKATPTFIIGDESLVGNVFAMDGARTIEKALRQ